MLATYLKLCKKIQILKVFSKLLVIMLLWACWLCICGAVLQVHPKWRSSIRQDLREIFPGTKAWEGPLLPAWAGVASVTGWPRWSMSIILYHISCSWPGVSQHRHQHITSQLPTLHCRLLPGNFSGHHWIMRQFSNVNLVLTAVTNCCLSVDLWTRFYSQPWLHPGQPRYICSI